MKKIVFYTLAIVLMAGCSKSNNESNRENPDALVPITLGSGAAITSKAPVTPGATFTAGIAGWEHASAPDYSGAPTWSTKVSTTAVAPGGTAASVTWTEGEKYYNADGTIKTFLKAWYPEGTLTTSTVTFANTDGTVDAMLAPVINGDKVNNTGKVLAFEHKTTQLTFTVQAGEGMATGTKINSIKINGAELPTGFDLEAGTVTYSAAANNSLVIPGIDGTQVINSNAVAAGNAVMIKPSSGNTLSIDVETDKASYTNQTVTVSDSNVIEGTHYVIALTFGQANVGITATVKAWIPSTGSGSIE